MIHSEPNEISIYVIDHDFHIVYANGGLSDLPPEVVAQRRCYEPIGGEDCQCAHCPLREEDRGQSLLFDHLRGDWVSVTATRVHWPDVGDCHLLMADLVGDHSKSFFYNVLDKSDYTELLKLNYADDTYTVVYHGERMDQGQPQAGPLSSMVRSVAQRIIHPEDRERFCEFWLLDRVGSSGVPDETLKTRHAEFRRLRPDGSYCLAQQIFMPVRQDGESDVLVISFYNVIDERLQWSELPLAADARPRGLYDKHAFFQAVESLAKQSASSRQLCLVSIDIDNLKLFNAWYGMSAGDSLIRGISDCLKDLSAQKRCIAGYFGNDDFALLTRYDAEQIEQLYHTILALLESYSNKTGFLPAFGVYLLTDPNEPAFTMYDRAELARSAVKGNYTRRVRVFDPAMLEQMESTHILFSDIKRALENNEFTFFLQPKCNMENGKVMGAEALVRWISKEKGMISPGVFIPFLEHSGFISELDPIIWEAVCKWQRSMLDRGRRTVPVSVNVSRADIYSMDVPAIFLDLIRKYDLGPELIEVEITESTYTEDNDFISRVVTELRRSGFKVLMDDFGSGYSSLNMLKDVEVDVLKIDMRFLSITEDNASKGIGILEAVHNMARLMGIGVIVEGVETEAQKAFLLKLGCGYGQGYYFYRPLPIAQFEAIQDPSNLDTDGFHDQTFDHLVWKDLLSEDLFSEVMLDHLLGAVVVYDVCGLQINIRRYNDHYRALLGVTEQSEIQIDPRSFPYYTDYQALFRMFKTAQNSRHDGAECEVRRRAPDGSDLWLHLRTFFLASQDGHALFYSSVTDVTDIHRNNELLKQQNDALQFLNNDMPGGYYRQKNDLDCTLLHVSGRFLEIVGFTWEEIQAQFDGKLANMIHPEDRLSLPEWLSAVSENGGNCFCTYRIRSKGGYITVVDQFRLVSYDGEQFFQGIILSDIDYRTQSAIKPSDSDFSQGGNGRVAALMPCGVFQYEADGEHRFVYVSDSMLDMLGYSRAAFTEKFHNNFIDMVYHEDRARISEEIRRQIQHCNYDSCEYRIEMADGSLKWFYDRGRLTIDADGKRWFYVCIIDYDQLLDKYREQSWRHTMYKSLAQIPGTMVFHYDPLIDELTMERTLPNRSVTSMVSKPFLAELERHDWLCDPDALEHKAAIQSALLRPAAGAMTLQACFPGDSDFHWYRIQFQSLADENGTGIFRVVGRAENIDAEQKL